MSYMIDMYYMISILYMISMLYMSYQASISYQHGMSFLYSMLLYVYDTIPIYFYIYVSRETLCETSIYSTLYSVL